MGKGSIRNVHEVSVSSTQSIRYESIRTAYTEHIYAGVEEHYNGK